MLLRGLKRRLEKAKGSWAEEVPRIVWAYHTTEQSGTHETPFSLVYGCDAMIPVEIQESSPRFQNFVEEVMAFHVFFLNQSSKDDAEAMGE